MISHARLFQEVARQRSFSVAARSLGVTQSAISQRVSQLEKRLGVELFDRSVRPLVLTPAGEAYAQGLGPLLGELDRLERRVTRLGGGAAAGPEVLRVAAIYSAGIDLMSRAAEAWNVRGDGLDVAVTYGKPDEVHRRVVEGDADLGLLAYGAKLERVVARPMWWERMMVVCPPEHRLAREAAVRPRHLASVEMVGFDRSLPVGRAVDAYFKSQGVVVALCDRFDNLDTLKAAVRATGRPAVLPWRTVAEELADQAMVCVELNPALYRPISVIARRLSSGRGEAGGWHASGDVFLQELQQLAVAASPGTTAVLITPPDELPTAAATLSTPRSRPPAATARRASALQAFTSGASL